MKGDLVTQAFQFRVSGTGDWKVARTRRLESLRYTVVPAPAKAVIK
jgi:hypothetical protein